jgi:hypothetical protein
MNGSSVWTSFSERQVFFLFFGLGFNINAAIGETTPRFQFALHLSQRVRFNDKVGNQTARTKGPFGRASAVAKTPAVVAVAK